MSGRRLSYSETEARAAIAAARSYAEALRNLGLCSTGGAWRVLKKWTATWGIPTDHFDSYASQRGTRNPRLALEDVLTADSTYSRGTLKRRLYSEGLKQPVCELCGQDETWRGRAMSLILDHVNGVSTDNRLENLQIVCPNCAATLDTHCGRNAERVADRECERCRTTFRPSRREQRFCSVACGTRHGRTGIPKPAARKVERPPYVALQQETEELGFLATGRKYGVSDNAVRKWLRWYANEAARAAGEGGAPDRTA